MTDRPPDDDPTEIVVPAATGTVATTTRRGGVVRIRRPETVWLSTGPNGGPSRGPVAYSVSVPDGWDRTDLAAYVEERRRDAGFETPGPALLTGLAARHARVARAGAVAVLATAGLSNPAPLLVDDDPRRPADDGGARPNDDRTPADNGVRPNDGHGSGDGSSPPSTPADRPGTVNVVALVDRALRPAARANLLTVVAEAKATTLLDAAGVPGTTTDAVIVGTATEETAETAVRFSGSGTEIGAAVRACTHDAIRESLRSRYGDGERPGSVAEAEHGVVASVSTEVTQP